MSENLTDGNKVGHAAPSWVTNDSTPVGRIARSEGLVSHREGEGRRTIFRSSARGFRI